MKPSWGCQITLTVLMFMVHQPEHLRIQGKAVMRLFMNTAKHLTPTHKKKPRLAGRFRMAMKALLKVCHL